MNLVPFEKELPHPCLKLYTALMGKMQSSATRKRAHRLVDIFAIASRDILISSLVHFRDAFA